MTKVEHDHIRLAKVHHYFVANVPVIYFLCLNYYKAFKILLIFQKMEGKKLYPLFERLAALDIMRVLSGAP